MSKKSKLALLKRKTGLIKIQDIEFNAILDMNAIEKMENELGKSFLEIVKDLSAEDKQDEKENKKSNKKEDETPKSPMMGMLNTILAAVISSGEGEDYTSKELAQYITPKDLSYIQESLLTILFDGMSMATEEKENTEGNQEPTPITQ